MRFYTLQGRVHMRSRGRRRSVFQLLSRQDNSRANGKGSRVKLFCVLLMAGLAALPALGHAATIPGLVNTGVGATGSVDNNYKFGGVGTAAGTACTQGGGQCGVISAKEDTSFPFNVWLRNEAGSASSWITPTTQAGQSYDPVLGGQYTWTLTFDLTGFDASTASFSGRFLSDNAGTVSLNSTVLNSTPTSPIDASFRDWTLFDSTHATFAAGINTLVFTVANYAQLTGNPTGVRVEFLSSEAQRVTPVPEPAALALALAGMGVVAGGLSRRRRAGQPSAQ